MQVEARILTVVEIMPYYHRRMAGRSDFLYLNPLHRLELFPCFNQFDAH